MLSFLQIRKKKSKKHKKLLKNDENLSNFEGISIDGFVLPYSSSAPTKDIIDEINKNDVGYKGYDLGSKGCDLKNKDGNVKDVLVNDDDDDEKINEKKKKKVIKEGGFLASIKKQFQRINKELNKKSDDFLPPFNPNAKNDESIDSIDDENNNNNVEKNNIEKENKEINDINIHKNEPFNPNAINTNINKEEEMKSVLPTSSENEKHLEKLYNFRDNIQIRAKFLTEKDAKRLYEENKLYRETLNKFAEQLGTEKLSGFKSVEAADVGSIEQIEKEFEKVESVCTKLKSRLRAELKDLDGWVVISEADLFDLDSWHLITDEDWQPPKAQQWTMVNEEEVLDAMTYCVMSYIQKTPSFLPKITGMKLPKTKIGKIMDLYSSYSTYYSYYKYLCYIIYVLKLVI